MKVALVVGHSPKDPGAVNEYKELTEFAFNKDLAKRIEQNWEDYSLTDELYIMYRETNYKDLPEQINATSPDLVVSLHANAFNGDASGCEMLYYHKSERSKTIASLFQTKILGVLKNKNRGIVPRSSEDRGGYLLRFTNAPCVICEPFFLDNNSELELAIASVKNNELVEAYCEAIAESVQYLRQEHEA